MKGYPPPDWAEYLIVFGFLVVAVIILGYVGALVGELIFRLV